MVDHFFYEIIHSAYELPVFAFCCISELKTATLKFSWYRTLKERTEFHETNYEGSILGNDMLALNIYKTTNPVGTSRI
ncbi:MAG: hypothetical protein ABIC04_01305 [Nanoarchaeota archaeon]